MAIEGADSAELQGERAALSLLADLGIAIPSRRLRHLRARVRRLQKFRRGIERAFPFPESVTSAIPKDTLVCRCEAVTLAQLDEAMEELGPDGSNRLKAFSRIGMGRCQGRVCGPYICEYLAARTGSPVSAISPLRPQAPIKPLAFAKAARHAEPGHELPQNENEGA